MDKTLTRRARPLELNMVENSPDLKIEMCAPLGLSLLTQLKLSQVRTLEIPMKNEYTQVEPE